MQTQGAELISLFLGLGILVGLVLCVILPPLWRWLNPHVLPALSLRPLHKHELRDLAPSDLTGNNTSHEQQHP